MSNIIFSMIPFILFSFICVILTMRRYSKTVTRVVWAVLVGAVSAVHLAIGIALPDHAFLIALMPVTAYLPVIIAVFVLSKRSFTGNVFVISVTLLACVISGLVRKLVVSFGFDGVWGDVLCALIVAAVSAAVAFVVCYFLRRIFRDDDMTEKKNLFLLPAMFLPVVLSLYQISSVSDIAAILLLLATDLCVFGVMTAYLVTRHKNTKLRAEREETLRQMEFEREEYKLSEQKLELGRRYRHDMRHHFAAIRGILAQGDTGQVEEYLDALEEGLGGIEQRGYCQNTVINAVLSNLLGRAERAGVDVRVQVNIPKDIPFESSDVSILLANALENAVNACIRAEEGKRALTLSAECADGKFKCMIANSVAARVPLGQDGLPVAARTEEHGYGMASIRYIVQKYSGVLRCESADESFSVRLVLFEKSDVRHKGRKKRVGTRALTAVPLGLVALLLSFNCMPATVSALEDAPVLGAAVAAVDFRNWGFGWGDSELDVTYPQTGNETVDKTIEDYIDACVDEFITYFGLRDQGYVGADIMSSVLVENDAMLTIRVSYTLNAGSSLSYEKYFVIDKARDEIADLSDLFREDSGYLDVLSAEIVAQIEYRVEHYYDTFYGYGIWENEPAFEDLGACMQDWSFYIDANGLLVIAFADDTISPMGSVSFLIPHTLTDAIASEDGLLLRRAVQ